LLDRDRQVRFMSCSDLPSYALISPVCDEAAHFAHTADSILAQSHRPLQWVVVDDGSRDDTRRIDESYAAEHPWICVIDSGQSSARARGAKIVRAFNAGLARLDADPEILVKMDGDIMLPSHYFQWVAETFARMPRAGVVGGQTRTFDGERWVPDDVSHHNVNGAAKAYRRACFEEIGGLHASMGWDGIDEYAARARGWQVYVLSELEILHYKPRGSRQRWRIARWEEGVGAHYMGYRLDFMLLRVLYRMLAEPPLGLAGLVFAAGFLYATLTGMPVVEDRAASATLRAEQRERLRGLIALKGRHASPPSLPGGGPAFWTTSERVGVGVDAGSCSRASTAPLADRRRADESVSAELATAAGPPTP
jgi:GT2 family glycosyltransferase